MKYVKTKVILFSIVVLLFLIHFSQQVNSCSPARPDPWFTEELVVDTSTFPVGVEVVETDPEYEPYSLINRSDTPFYIVRERTTRSKNPSNSGIPDEYEPLYKLKSGQAFFWGQRSSNENEHWIANSGGINNSAATSVKISNEIYSLDTESKQVYKFNRPNDIDIPEPQSLTIRGYFRGEPVVITGVVNYSLNEKYDIEKMKEYASACDDFGTYNWWSDLGFVIPLILILFVFLSMGTTSLIIHRRHKNKSESNVEQ